jgi:hypothetical protein
MITKVKLSTSQHPVDGANNTKQPGGVIYPVGSGINLKGTTPTANGVTFDDSTDGLVLQGATILARLIAAATGIVAAFKFLVPIKVQNTDCGLYAGNGSPEGVVTANPGSLYLNAAGGAGTSLYVKQSGVSNTGWVGK